MIPGLHIPRITADRICCPQCHQRVTYRPDGLPDWHLAGEWQCPGMWPPYVVGAPDDRRAARRRSR